MRRGKPRETDYRLADSAGLYLLVTSAEGQLWRRMYRLHGVEKKLAPGRYPEVLLNETRKARDAAREMAGASTDPSVEKRRKRIAARIAVGTTFGAVSEEYIQKADREGRAPATVAKLRWARDWLLPAIDHRPVDQVEPHDLLSVLRRQEAKGNLETARRPRAFATGLLRLPEIQLIRLPRMADFALWGCACETAIWPEGTFLSACADNQDKAVEDVLEGD